MSSLSADRNFPSEATALDYVRLMKPRVMSLVVFTALVGLLAAPVQMDWVTGASAVLAVALTEDYQRLFAVWFLVGTAAAFGVLLLTADLMMWVAKRVGRPKMPLRCGNWPNRDFSTVIDT